MDGTGSESHRVLKRFEQREILGDVVVLPAYPLGNADFLSFGNVDDYANTSRPWIAQRPSIDVGD